MGRKEKIGRGIKETWKASKRRKRKIRKIGEARNILPEIQGMAKEIFDKAKGGNAHEEN